MRSFHFVGRKILGLMIMDISPRAQLVLFLGSRPSIRLILYSANISTDNENQSLMKIYFNNCSESKMAAKICGFI